MNIHLPRLFILATQIFFFNFLTCNSYVDAKRFMSKEAISVINGYRKLHLGDGHALKEDKGLKKKAIKSALQAVSNQGFPDNIKAGETIYQVCASFGVKISPKQVVKAWYDEVCTQGLDFDKGIFDNAESFSQLVWKDSYYVGIAARNGKKGNQTCKYISAFFRPPGNIQGFYQENVKLGNLKLEEYCDNL